MEGGGREKRGKKKEEGKENEGSKEEGRETLGQDGRKGRREAEKMEHKEEG